MTEREGNLMARILAVTALVLLGVCPVGVGVGLWLCVNVGAGISATSALYGAVAAGVLLIDVGPREVSR